MQAPIDTPSILVAGSPQHAWLEADLAKARTTTFVAGLVTACQARANPNTPWIVVGGFEIGAVTHLITVPLQPPSVLLFAYPCCDQSFAHPGARLLR